MVTGSLNSLTLPSQLHSLSQWTQPLSSTSVREWDLIEDSGETKQLWKELPPLQRVPFAQVLFLSENQTARGNLSQRVHNLTKRVPLQDFEWPSFLDRRQRLVREADLRLRVYHSGVTPSLRPIVWRHLLFVFPPQLTSAKRKAFLQTQHEEYAKLKLSWSCIDKEERPAAMVSLVRQIKNDVVRTDRETDFFHSDESPHLDMLFNVLVTFALNSPEISYVQGLNDIAAVLLRVYRNEADTYICLHSLMRVTKALFTPEGLMLKFAHLKALLHRFDSDMFQHLSSHNSQELIFCYRWLLLDMKREFNYSDAQRALEVMWSTLPPPKEYSSALRRYRKALKRAQTTLTSAGDPQRASRPRSVRPTSLVTQDELDGREHAATSGPEVPSPTENSFQPLSPSYLEHEVSTPRSTWTVIDVLPEGAHEHTASEVHRPLSPQDQELTEFGRVAILGDLSQSLSSSTVMSGPASDAPATYFPMSASSATISPNTLPTSPADPIHRSADQPTRGQQNMDVDDEEPETGSSPAESASGRHDSSPAESASGRHDSSPADSASGCHDSEHTSPALPSSFSSFEHVHLPPPTPPQNDVVTRKGLPQLSLSFVHASQYVDVSTTVDASGQQMVDIEESNDACESTVGGDAQDGGRPDSFDDHSVSHTEPSATGYFSDYIIVDDISCEDDRVADDDVAQFVYSGDDGDDTNNEDDAQAGDDDVNMEICSTYGNPFILFVIVALLTLHRRHLLRHDVSEETLSLYFDRHRHHHNMTKILSKARQLFAQYLQMEMSPLQSIEREKPTSS